MNVKEEKINIQVPKLKNKDTFRPWSEGIRRLLEAKSLDVYLNYEIKVVRLMDEEEKKSEIDKFVSKFITSDVLYRIPLQERLYMGVGKYHFYSVDSSDEIPDALLGLMDLCDVVQEENKLTLLVERGTYVQLARKLREDRSKIFSIFHTSVSKPIYELIRKETSVAAAYTILVNNYRLDTYVEQQNMRVKISKLYIGKLQTYLDTFEQLLAEYVGIGGSRDDTALYDTLVRHVSNSKYNMYYNIYSGTSTDELLLFLRPIAEKEKLDTTGNNATKQGRTSGNTKRPTLYANKVALQRGPNGKPIRCRRCNGWGHELSSCMLEEDVCHYCGEPGHFRKDCPQAQNRNKANKAQVLAVEEETSTHQHVHQPEQTNTNSYEALQDLFDTLDSEPEDEEDEFVTLNRVAINEEKVNSNYILDSGATRHVTGELTILEETQKLKNSLQVSTADGNQIKATLQGVLVLENDQGQELILENVLYCPGIHGTLISVRQLTRAGFKVHFNEACATVLHSNSTLFHAHFRRREGNYILAASRKKIADYSSYAALQVRSIEEKQLIHARFGHLNTLYLQRAGLGMKKSADMFCPSCSAGKLVHSHKKKLVNVGNTLRTTGRKPWEVIHLDTAGPFKVGIGQIRYFVVLVCDYTGYLRCAVVRKKSEITRFVGDIILKVEQLGNLKTKSLFSDNGREFINKDMTKFCFQNSIFQQTRSTNFPSENGKAERAIRSLKTITRNLLLTSGLGKRFWGYAVLYASEILNVIPRKGQLESPFERTFKFKPNYKRFKVFGSPGHALATREDSLSGYPTIIFLGFSQRNHSYVVMLTGNRSIREFRDISVNEVAVLEKEQQRFSEQLKPKKRTKPIQQTSTSENVQFEEENTTRIVPKKQVQSTHDKATSVEHELTQNDEGEVEESSSDSEDTEIRNFCDVHEDNILSTDRRGNTINQASIEDYRSFWCSTTFLGPENITLNVLTTQDELKPPRTWKDIESREDKQQWIEAYQKEVDSLESVAGMLVVDHPRSEEVLELLEIFSWKENTYSGKREAKVRMAGRGDKAKIKLALYSPVGGAVGMRMLIHVSATYFDSRLQASDVRTAFLNTRTKVARYFHLPQGHKSRVGKSKVWKTFCALYGLTEASFHWYKCLTEYLKKVGLSPCSSDECLFMTKDEEGRLNLLVLIYVDDLLFTGTEESVRNFCKLLEDRFKIRKTEEVKSFIGVQIEKIPTGFKLYQEKFILEAVEKFELTEAKSVSTPIDISCLEDCNSRKLEDKRLFQSVIGTVNYITCCTRPDIAFAVNLLARRLQAPTLADLKRAKRILIYLRDTKDKGIIINKINPKLKLKVKTYVDASLGNGQKRKSIFGYIILLGENIIAFKSKKQEIVAQSTCEAEYVALAYSIKETLWIERLLSEVGINYKTSVIYCDNAGAIKIANKQSATGRTRHLDLRLQMIKDLIAKGQIEISYVRSDLNIADIFTKPLGRLLFSKVADAIMDKRILHSKEEC